MSVAFKTMSIKARVYNQIRKQLYKKVLKEITPKEKEAFFDNLFKLNTEAHIELREYKRKRREKARIEKLRHERGYYEKKRAKKASAKMHIQARVADNR